MVSPRPPRPDGRGDQRRASEIVAALSEEWTVDVLSWLPDVDGEAAGLWEAGPRHLARSAMLTAVLPAHVAYVQGRAPRTLPAEAGRYEAAVFVTDRAVPGRPPANAVIDFVDDTGGTLLKRAQETRGVRALLWRWEGNRLRRLDRRLARSVRLCLAHSPAEAAGIADTVRPVTLSHATRPLPDTGQRVAFLGNLFYGPNHEAAMWICSRLAPALEARGIPPATLLIAGRRPEPSLRSSAAEAGVELQADVPDLSALLGEAAVVLSPMRQGAGSQYKVIDAVGAGRACVVSPLANTGLALVDGQSALIREREPEAFADAIAALLSDPALRSRLVAAARDHLVSYQPESVAAEWRAVLRGFLASSRSSVSSDSL